MKIELIALPTNPDVSLTAYILDNLEGMEFTKKRPAILVLPGGGYNSCSDREGEPIAMSFLAEGYNVFILRYSVDLNAKFPNPLTDAEYALELIREKAEEWQTDGNKIAVCGFSAGGHLAAALGTMGRVRPNAMILAYPCILSSIGKILADPDIPSVEKEVDDKTPPAFIAATFMDRLVPVENSLEFARALNTAEIPYELHIFENGQHGLATSKALTGMVDKDFVKWTELCVSWLKHHFGDFDSENE